MRGQGWLIVAFVAAVASTGAGWRLYVSFEGMTRTVAVTVPAVEVLPQTRISPEMLTTRDLPLTLSTDSVYREMAQVVGKVAAVRLFPGRPIYESDVVRPTQFHLSGDAHLEVAVLKVTADQAPPAFALEGRRINVYEARPAEFAQRTPISAALLAVPPADVELVAADALALNVRVMRSTDTDSQLLITVAVPPDLSRRIIALQAGQSSAVWVTLAARNRPTALESTPMPQISR